MSEMERELVCCPCRKQHQRNYLMPTLFCILYNNEDNPRKDQEH